MNQTPAQRIAAFLDAWADWRKNQTPPLGLVAFGPSDESPDLERDDLRAVLADNERLTRELDDLADFDKADERRRTLQDERDRAVRLWHEQHKQLSAVRVVADMLAGAALPPGDHGPTAHAIGAIRVGMWHQAAGMIRTALAAEPAQPPAIDDRDGRDGQEGAGRGTGGSGAGFWDGRAVGVRCQRDQGGFDCYGRPAQARHHTHLAMPRLATRTVHRETARRGDVHVRVPPGGYPRIADD